MIAWDFLYNVGCPRPLGHDLLPVDPERNRFLHGYRFSVFKKSLVGIERRARNPHSLKSHPSLRPNILQKLLGRSSLSH
jgi:hypothetical protein